MELRPICIVLVTGSLALLAAHSSEAFTVRTIQRSSSTIQMLSPSSPEGSPIQFPLEGIWKGEGHVLNSSGERKAHYLEQSEFRPCRTTPDFSVYRMQQDTRHLESNKPMHTETGFMKVSHDGTDVVASFAHPFPSGFVNEMSRGHVQNGIVTLESTNFQRAASFVGDDTTKKVTGYKRVYWKAETKLCYDQFLTYANGEPYHHLHCELEEISG